MPIIHKLRINTLTTLIISLLAIFTLSATNSFADEHKDEDSIEIAELLTEKEAPHGVVFELIGSEDNYYLPNALEKIETYKKQLQAKFPNIEFAVVSHGGEQFELTKKNASKSIQSHKSVQRLVASDVPVHICETHASWRNVEPEDFPDYITTSPQGPSQIRQYQELGYLLIIVE